ncbi:MAG: hypothetical protein ACHQT9_04720 [Candidatus Saccharimonadales bacterium]
MKKRSPAKVSRAAINRRGSLALVKKVSRAKVIRRNPQKLAIKRIIRQKRAIHRKLLLHPVTVLILLCAVVFVATWTFGTSADNYTVSATIQAAPLTEGAVITDPADGQTTTSSPTTVSGSCPTGSYVKLSDNNLFSGVDLCRVDNTFHITTSLFLGSNSLKAQDYNITDAPGPSTTGITVTYNQPIPPSPSPANPSTPAAPIISSSTEKVTDSQSNPLILQTDFQYNTSTTGTQFVWQLDVGGGTAPYIVTVDWGDGSSSTYTFTTDPIFTIAHTYTKIGYYPIKVASVDAAGQKRVLQLATVVRKPGSPVIVPPAATTQTPKPGIGHTSDLSLLNGVVNKFELTSKSWLWVAWPSLIIVSLMVVSFWLGERQEKKLLFRKVSHRPKPRKAH